MSWVNIVVVVGDYFCRRVDPPLRRRILKVVFVRVMKPGRGSGGKHH